MKVSKEDLLKAAQVYGHRRDNAYEMTTYEAIYHGFPPRPIASDMEEDQWNRYGNVHYSRRRKAYLHRSVDDDQLFYLRRMA